MTPPSGKMLILYLVEKKWNYLEASRNRKKNKRKKKKERKANPSNTENGKRTSIRNERRRSQGLLQEEKILEKEEHFIKKMFKKVWRTQTAEENWSLQEEVHGPPFISEATDLENVKQKQFLVRNILTQIDQPQQTHSTIVYRQENSRAGGNWPLQCKKIEKIKFSLSCRNK